ncbi:MAG: NYN domain-containing protein [Verrucomicrobiota bacterium]
MTESRPSFLLVDGNNIIHAWPELRERHEEQRGSAHAELIRELREYGGWSGDRVVVVFDGRGVGVSEEPRESGLQVFYTSDGRSADAVIEELARRYAGIYDITVATDDRLEQDVVVGAGGNAISSGGLRDRIDAGQRSRDEWLERRRSD